MAETLPLSAAFALLDRGPSTMRSWLAGIGEDWLDHREAPETWSPREVVCHCVYNERVDWMPRIRHVLQHGTDVAFTPFDRSGHRPLLPVALDELLDEFADLRWQNLQALRALDLGSTALAREGLHPTLGRVTIGHLIAAWVAHDQNHLAQIARVLASRCAAHVGPWDHPDYLGVLHWRRRDAKRENRA